MKGEISKAHPAAPLNYHAKSPVRGQLEPYDLRVNKGWPGRFLQCTETPNQLKVLLPPRTAALYEQLLKAETFELAKKTPSWERLLEIRHLKERMIRKCQKSCKATPVKRLGRGESFAFQTFIAPSDFRLKEMEKWLKQHEGQGDGFPSLDVASYSGRSYTSNSAKRNSLCCHRCSQPNCIENHKASSSAPSSVVSPLVRPVSPESSSDESVDQGRIQGSREHTPSPLQFPEPVTHPVLPLPRASAFSPEPLQHPFGPRSSLTLDEPHEIDEGGPSHQHEHDQEEEQELPQPSEIVPTPLPAIDENEVLDENNDKYVPPPLRTRRSCIKRTASGDNLKTVSWADDPMASQLTKYANAAREAQDSGRQWEELRDMYTDQIHGLDALHLHVVQGLDRIRLETERLRGIEDAIMAQRRQIIDSCRALEVKQAEFQSKVKNALEEADHTLVAVRSKKDPEP
ncbi:hypothetical protein ONZ45_g7782 [Pleurotus djamor]|nr:hypothetical protein ONZ45_g7782 [Pleurotus djamor]